MAVMMVLLKCWVTHLKIFLTLERLFCILVRLAMCLRSTFGVCLALSLVRMHVFLSFVSIVSPSLWAVLFLWVLFFVGFVLFYVYLINVLYYINADSMQIFSVLISLFFVGTLVTLAIACGYFKHSSVELSEDLDKVEYR